MQMAGDMASDAESAEGEEKTQTLPYRDSMELPQIVDTSKQFVNRRTLLKRLKRSREHCCCGCTHRNEVYRDYGFVGSILGFFPRMFASYLTWSIGESQRVVDHIFFHIVCTVPRWLATWALWHLLVAKVVQGWTFIATQRHCLQQHRHLTFYPEYGTYKCTACDWACVDETSRGSWSKCLDRLFAQPRTEHELQLYLQDASNHGASNLTRLDLSQQLWGNWTHTNDTLAVLKPFAESVREVSLAAPLGKHSLELNQSQWGVMADFLGSLPALQMLNLSGRALPPAILPKFVDSVAKTPVQVLDLSHSHLPLSALRTWLTALGPQLIAVFAREAMLYSDNVSSKLDAALKMPHLRSLELDGSEWGPDMPEVLAGWMESIRALETLSLSGMAFDTRNSLDGLLNATRRVRHLRLSMCNIDHYLLKSMVDSWTGSTVRMLDLSHNVFGFKGADYLFQKMASQLASLNIGYINSFLPHAFSNWLKGSSLSSLSLSGLADWTVNERAILFESLLALPITNLELAEMALEYQDIVNIAALMDSRGVDSPLRRLDLRYNYLSNTGISLLFALVNHTNIDTLLLDNNDLSQPLSQVDWDAALAGNESLRHLSIRSTELSDLNLARLSNALELGRVESLSLAFNHVSDSATRSLFTSMRRQQPMHTTVLQRLLGRIHPTVGPRCSQTNLLTELDIDGIFVSSETLDVLCEALQCFDHLDIDGVAFGHAQLALSSNVRAQGCPI